MTRIIIIAGAIICVIAGTASAQRAGMNPLRQLPLTQQDMAAVAEVVGQLTEEERVGESAEWSNPASGNSGTATLLELFEENGYHCRRVAHQFKIKGRADQTQLEFKTCLDPSDNMWKLV
jgi:surface antigen